MSFISRIEPTINRILCHASLETIASLPSPVFCHLGEKIINHALRPLIIDGQLEALDGRCWKIEVSDAPRTVYIRLIAGRFSITDREREWDVCFKGPLASFLVLALKQEDPDTLFFNRQLSISGDTELGLAIKNFIDSVEVDEVLKPPVSVLIEQLNRAFSSQQVTTA